MSRVIKFRAWHKEHETIIYFDPEKLTKDMYQGSALVNLMFDNDNDGGVLMQFTGLTDKNGKDIFEGDVVKVWHFDEPEEVQIGKVWWFNCYYPAFDIYIPSDKAKTGFESYSDELNAFSIDDVMYEVIGNIYENKELLNDS